MLVFADESGDPGPVGKAGASERFTVAAVAFEDAEDAQDCEARIRVLRARLSVSARSEFRFRNDRHERRLQFLAAIAPARFLVAAASTSKASQDHVSFGRVCVAAIEELPLLPPVRIVADETGGRAHRTQLRRELRLALGERLHSVRTARSQSEDLLQVADYAAGIAARLAGGRAGGEEYLDALGRHRLILKLIGQLHPPWNRDRQGSGSPRAIRPRGNPQPHRAACTSHRAERDAMRAGSRGADGV